MSANFSSWLQFDNQLNFIQSFQNSIFNQLIKNFDFKIIERSFRLPDNKLIYSYILNQEKPEINQQSIILNKPEKKVYIKYEYAVNNLVSFIPENSLNLDDIKGFNLMDYVLVPTLETKEYVKKKIPNIDKVIFMPFYIEQVKKTSKDQLTILCIEPKDLDNKRIKEYLKISYLQIYSSNIEEIIIKLPKDRLYSIKSRENLYYDLISNSIIIDFNNDFLASIIQKKALINNIPYIGVKNTFSNIDFVNDGNKTFEQMITEASAQIEEYSLPLKEMFSSENCEKVIRKLLENIQEDHSKVNYYRTLEKEKLSYQKQIEKVIKQIPENKTYLYLDQQELNNQQLKQLIEDYDYLIITKKNTSQNIENLSELFDGLNISQKIEFGSPELKLSEKEMLLIVITQSDNQDKKMYVTWEGYQLFHISLAVINRELEIKMIENKDYQISIVSQDYYRELNSDYKYFNQLTYCFDKPLLKKNDFYIRHVLPAGLSSPTDGKYILIIPWEAGNIPEYLVNHINKEVDQLWCPSEYIKQLHINSGVIKRKIQVIPNGIDLNIFKPVDQKITESIYKNEKKFKFLFVGGILFRKGLDLLIEAYFSEFKNSDDVTLILKGLGENTYYNSDKAKNLLLNNDKNKAEIIFLDKNLNEQDLAYLYSSADAYVHPYRAEGFGMPIYEAMACGTVPIVTRYGPSLEYCDDTNSFLIDYYPKENINEGTFIEPDINHLRKIMRLAYENPDLVKVKSAKAIESVKKLSWDNIFNLIDNKLKNIKNLPEYRNDREFYIQNLLSQISETKDNSEILNELKVISEPDIYKEIYAKERFNKKDYRQALKLYSELFNSKKDKKYIENIYQILILVGDNVTAEKIIKLKS